MSFGQNLLGGTSLLKFSEVQQILNAQALCGSEMLDDIMVHSVCGADLLSDVLAFCKENTLLLTGITNLQVIRTVELSDLIGIVFVRGKKPDQDVVKAAKDKNIPVLVTKCTMYEACGLLYATGLPGCSEKKEGLLNA